MSVSLKKRPVNVEGYSVDQLADAWQVDPKTVRRLIWKGELGCVHIGRAVRITREQLDAYLGREGE